MLITGEILEVDSYATRYVIDGRKDVTTRLIHFTSCTPEGVFFKCVYGVYADTTGHH